MTDHHRRARRARRGLLAAATVVLFLALGPFATPLVGHGDGGIAAGAPVDHRNDLPVVRPGRPSTPSVSARLPSSRSLLVLALVVGVLVGRTAVRWRRPDPGVRPDRPPLWSLPPHRGPPLLAAG